MIIMKIENRNCIINDDNFTKKFSYWMNSTNRELYLKIIVLIIINNILIQII